ncbi:NAD(P)-dependent oxidoreductase [Betaproteobacteria bacterium GR16-43]|nr:NAD(P)-dependent oxidoreductase [Betaproteobacteria bacterium GR16-43]
MTPTSSLPPGYTPPTNLLEGRAVLVTGAGQGLGQAVALACAAHGATVALLGRKPKKLEATADAIEAAGGAEPVLVPFDLAEAGTAQFEQLAHLLRRELKRLDGIAHCASHFVPLTPLAHQGLESWLVLLRVNLAAPAALTRACLPLLAAAPDASVVFTGETHGLDPAAFWGAFAIGKSALPALAKVWADELEKSGTPRMNVLVPGPMNTPQRAMSHPGEDRSRLRSAESVAVSYLYLLGPDSRGRSGETLRM